METVISQLNDWDTLPRAITATALLLAGSAGTGRLVFRQVALRLPVIVDQLLLETCFGLNVIGWFGVVLGQVGAFQIFSPLMLLCPGIAVTIGSLVHAVRTRRQLRLPISGRWCFSGSNGLLVTIGLVTLGPSLCYPSGWDELVYHHVLPRYWLNEGMLSVRLDLPYSAFPSLSEVLGWIVAPVESLISARLLNWCFWFTSVCWLSKLLQNQGLPPFLSVSLAAAVACSKAFLLIGQNCYVETLIIINFVALLHVLISARLLTESNTLALPVITGVLSGACMTVKLTAAAVPVVAILFWSFGLSLPDSALPSSAKTQKGRRLMWPAIMSLSVAVFVAPFLARSYLATGNPVFPYLASMFTNDPASIACSQFHHSISASVFGVHSLPAFLSGPVLLAFEDDVYDGSFGWQFPLMILLAGWSIIQCYLDKRNEAAPASGKASYKSNSGQSPYQTRMLGWLMVSVFLMYTFWFLTAQQSRFFAPAMPLVAICAASGILRLQAGGRKMMACLLLSATFVSLPFRAIGYYAGSWETLFGRFSWEEYISDGTGQSYFEAAKFLDSQAKPTSRILLLFEHRSLLVSGSCEIGTPWFQPHEVPGLVREADATAFAKYLQDSQFDFVFAANRPIGPDQAPEWHDRWESAFQTLQSATQQGLLRPVWTSDEHTIWRLETSAVSSTQKPAE